MGAFDPAGALYYGGGEDPGFAEQFQRDAGADDIHDGIHRANFVKMHGFHGLAMDPALDLGKPLEDGGGFLFYPGGKFAGGNELFDLCKIAGIVVVMVVTVAVLMIVLMRTCMFVVLPGGMEVFMGMLLSAMGMRMAVGMTVLAVMVMVMVMRASMLVVLPGRMGMLVGVLMRTRRMRVAVGVVVVVVVVVIMSLVRVVGFEVDIDFDAGDAAFFLLVDMQVVAIEIQFAEFATELLGTHAQVDERAEEHVATDAAEDVEVESFHGWAKRLIWLAA